MKIQKLKNQILDSINEQNYVKALEYYLHYEKEGYPFDDSIAILAGSIFHYFGERENAWDAISKGLSYNHANYELYVMLGNYYLEQNLIQAYLCFENALFFCDNEDDKNVIRSLMEQLSTEYQVPVPKTSFVILSYNLLEYTKKCIESIRSSTPESAREIIVVDNASLDGSVEWLRMQSDIILIENKDNVGFPAGCNQGITASSPNTDIFLLNNDTIVTPNSLFWLRMGLYENDNVGSTGSVSNYVANGQQIEKDFTSIEDWLSFSDTNNIPMKSPYEEKLCLVGFALLIKRSALNEIGLLDEIFTPGNCEDVDYGLRMLKAGYHNILCKNSFILHFGSKSFRKDDQKYFNLLENNILKLNSKWNMDISKYMHPSVELLDMISCKQDTPINILDINCGCGALMAKIKSWYPNSTIYGIEVDSEATAIARAFGQVICNDIEELELSCPENYFDYCIIGDALEHLPNPKKFLEILRRYIKQNGHIILSIQNVKHWSVLLPLLTEDAFSYSNNGLTDDTPSNIFTLREVLKLLLLCGYEVENYNFTTLGEPTVKEQEMIQNLVTYMKQPNISTFMAHKYVILAKVVD